MARIDARADIGVLLAVEVGVSKQRVDLGCGVDQMGDQAAERGEGRAVAVTQPRLIQPVDEVAGPLGHRAHQQHHVRRGHLFFEFHEVQVTRGLKPGLLQRRPRLASHTRCGATGPGRLRHLRCGARTERGLLRALRGPDSTGEAARKTGDSRRAAVLRAGGRDRDRFHVDLLRPALKVRRTPPPGG